MGKKKSTRNQVLPKSRRARVPLDALVPGSRPIDVDTEDLAAILAELSDEEREDIDRAATGKGDKKHAALLWAKAALQWALKTKRAGK